jgi:hypothetical protein
MSKGTLKATENSTTDTTWDCGSPDVNILLMIIRMTAHNIIRKGGSATFNDRDRWSSTSGADENRKVPTGLLT